MLLLPWESLTCACSRGCHLQSHLASASSLLSYVPWQLSDLSCCCSASVLELMGPPSELELEPFEELVSEHTSVVEPH